MTFLLPQHTLYRRLSWYIHCGTLLHMFTHLSCSVWLQTQRGKEDAVIYFVPKSHSSSLFNTVPGQMLGKYKVSVEQWSNSVFSEFSVSLEWTLVSFSNPAIGSWAFPYFLASQFIAGSSCIFPCLGAGISQGDLAPFMRERFENKTKIWVPRGLNAEGSPFQGSCREKKWELYARIHTHTFHTPSSTPFSLSLSCIKDHAFRPIPLTPNHHLMVLSSLSHFLQHWETGLSFCTMYLLICSILEYM